MSGKGKTESEKILERSQEDLQLLGGSDSGKEAIVKKSSKKKKKAVKKKVEKKSEGKFVGYHPITKEKVYK